MKQFDTLMGENVRIIPEFKILPNSAFEPAFLWHVSLKMRIKIKFRILEILNFCQYTLIVFLKEFLEKLSSDDTKSMKIIQYAMNFNQSG